VLTQLCAGVTNCKYLSHLCVFRNEIMCVRTAWIRRTEWYKIFSINTWYMGSRMNYNNANLTVKIQPHTTYSLYHFLRLIYAILIHVISFWKAQKWLRYLQFIMPAQSWVSTCHFWKRKYSRLQFSKFLYIYALFYFILQYILVVRIHKNNIFKHGHKDRLGPVRTGFLPVSGIPK